MPAGWQSCTCLRCAQHYALPGGVLCLRSCFKPSSEYHLQALHRNCVVADSPLLCCWQRRKPVLFLLCCTFCHKVIQFCPVPSTLPPSSTTPDCTLMCHCTDVYRGSSHINCIIGTAACDAPASCAPCIAQVSVLACAGLVCQVCWHHLWVNQRAVQYCGGIQHIRHRPHP